MDNAHAAAREMLDHCYSGSPGGFIGHDLLNSGSFPDGWVEKYLELVQQAEERYASLPHWPRELIAAAYVASVYCEKRYRDWRALHPEKPSNPETEAALQKIRWAGDQLILGWLWRQQDTPAV